MAFGMIQHGGLAGLGAKKTKPKSTKWTFPDINSKERPKPKYKAVKGVSAKQNVFTGTATARSWDFSSEFDRKVSDVKQRLIGQAWKLIVFSITPTYSFSKGVNIKIIADVHGDLESNRRELLRILNDNFTDIDLSADAKETKPKETSWLPSLPSLPKQPKQPKQPSQQQDESGWNLPNFNVPMQNSKAGVLDTINNGLATFAQGQIITVVIAGIVVLMLGKWLLKD